VIGGTLLLTPGFITDIVGVFLLIPPTRALARRLLRRLTVGRFAVVSSFPTAGGGPFGRGGGERDPFGPGGGAGAGRGAGPGGAPHYDYDVTAEEMPADGDGERRLRRSDDE
jgi:UPF0716 protein FxsA